MAYELEGQSSIWFIPDIDKWDLWEQSIDQVTEKSRAVFIDATFYDGDELPGRNMSEIPHPFVVETMDRLNSLPSDERSKVHFIHMNHTNPLLNPKSEAYDNVLAKGYKISKRGLRLNF